MERERFWAVVTKGYDVKNRGRRVWKVRGVSEHKFIYESQFVFDNLQVWILTTR